LQRWGRKKASGTRGGEFPVLRKASGTRGGEFPVLRKASLSEVGTEEGSFTRGGEAPCTEEGQCTRRGEGSVGDGARSRAAGRWREGRPDGGQARGRRRTPAVSCAAGKRVKRDHRGHNEQQAMCEAPPRGCETGNGRATTVTLGPLPRGEEAAALCRDKSRPGHSPRQRCQLHSLVRAHLLRITLLEFIDLYGTEYSRKPD
jgi:hypothetical protein